MTPGCIYCRIDAAETDAERVALAAPIADLARCVKHPSDTATVDRLVGLTIDLERRIKALETSAAQWDQFTSSMGVGDMGERPVILTPWQFRAWMGAAGRTGGDGSADVVPPEPPKVAPIPMVLHCPDCRARHVDVEFATKVHHTHSCQSCGLTWRPAVVATVGVQFLPGFKDEAEPPKPVEQRYGEAIAEAARATGGASTTPTKPVERKLGVDWSPVPSDCGRFAATKVGK